MTTTTRVSTPLTLKLGEKCRVGRDRILMQATEVAYGEISRTLYQNDSDVWFEGCGHCDADSGYKSYFAGVYGGVCFQCGGNGIRRVAGTGAGMIRIMRKRFQAMTSYRNAVQRKEDRDLALLGAWNVAHPNLASDLARVRNSTTLDGGPLREIALCAGRAPLTVRQESYVIALLTAVAWKEAHAIENPPRNAVYVGEVNSRLTLTGTLTVVVLQPARAYNRPDRMLLVMDHTNVDGDQVLVRMVTQAAWAFNAVKGQTITVTGTIKAHEESDYGKQTVLLRPKLA